MLCNKRKITSKDYIAQISNPNIPYTLLFVTPILLTLLSLAAATITTLLLVRDFSRGTLPIIFYQWILKEGSGPVTGNGFPKYG